MKNIIRIIIVFTLITVAASWQNIPAGGPSQSRCAITVPGLSVFAQETVTSSQDLRPDKNSPDASSTVLYQVMAVILVIWLGLGLFLFLIGRRVTRLEKNMSEIQGNGSR